MTRAPTALTWRRSPACRTDHQLSVAELEALSQPSYCEGKVGRGPQVVYRDGGMLRLTRRDRPDPVCPVARAVLAVLALAVERFQAHRVVQAVRRRTVQDRQLAGQLDRLGRLTGPNGRVERLGRHASQREQEREAGRGLATAGALDGCQQRIEQDRLVRLARGLNLPERAEVQRIAEAVLLTVLVEGVE